MPRLHGCQYSFIFEPAQLATLQQNLSMMQSDVRLQYQDSVDQSHEGRPIVIQMVYNGSEGRPSYEIDPDFLRWAYSLRPTSSIACFFGVDRSVVRRALDNDPELEADYPLMPEEEQPPHISSYTGPLSTITNDELDSLLIRLRQHYRRAGLTRCDGMLRRLGHHVPRARIRESYSVSNRSSVYSNALPSDDAYTMFQAPTRCGTMMASTVGLIRWGIVTHGFIDGYSRLITGLLASNNNRAQTVLLYVVAWMEAVSGK
ncbi:hypothetical protein B0H13DRAFT_2301047 [Mycena leptocephala]|nr:hypothetical protein B0H13DRAFT_2301047 [Mycena leptocephala]